MNEIYEAALRMRERRRGDCATSAAHPENLGASDDSGLAVPEVVAPTRGPVVSTTPEVGSSRFTVGLQTLKGVTPVISPEIKVESFGPGFTGWRKSVGQTFVPPEPSPRISATAPEDDSLLQDAVDGQTASSRRPSLEGGLGSPRSLSSGNSFSEATVIYQAHEETELWNSPGSRDGHAFYRDLEFGSKEPAIAAAPSAQVRALARAESVGSPVEISPEPVPPPTPEPAPKKRWAFWRRA